ncbi:MAG: hypothetical protein COX92_00690 [Candidatus Nealsonbacteria bacterium CG_4_10_14_0_2_um_filter_40_15]|uniref:Uncharacterized protein n=1 Tax=Candidatus Nealsonbacteria bacterium CG_4_10_14_0_2_um_filter_40_15 TaxID=1974682 RepID=A0A2M7UUS8_9BACT|nr:MAG: hypothetical protein COX92_00690 [Candidatus Nealsonbacteria bacterium CG_4_10_14_0_2_um_filter_40_15]
MATKHLSNNEDDFEEVDELEDPEVPEMGEEDILTPKNPEEMEFDDTDLEGIPETMEMETEEK